MKRRLQAAAPETFADPGQLVSELRLVPRGDTFAWKSKAGPAAKALPDSVQGAGMVLRENSDESEVSAVEVNGRSAWESVRRTGKPTYFYFKLNDPAFSNGRQPAVQVTITYLDRGNTPAFVQYDSSDGQANAAGT